MFDDRIIELSLWRAISSHPIKERLLINEKLSSFFIPRLWQDKVRDKANKRKMKVAKLIKISMAMLKLLSENGVRIDDYRYVDAYEEFLNMRQNRVSYRSAIKSISEERSISVRTLERVFKRLSAIVN